MSDEGDDPSPRPKRKIKKVMVLSSASESESDDSQPAASTRKKRLRVLSEDDSDSSSGSWALGALRRRRALPGLRDSSGDSDSSGWSSDGRGAPGPSAASASEPGTSKTSLQKATKTVSGFSSDSSEGNSEKCSICLMKFVNQEVGTPQNCEHIFCLDCITEWSKNMNTCPVDRISFDSIVVRTCVGGRVLRTEPVHVLERRPSVETMLIEDPTICEICLSADREESMLLCDNCDRGYHMQCLSPPLTRIPEDEWVCASCAGVWRSFPIYIPVVYSDAFRQSLARDGLGELVEELPSTSSGRRGERRAPASGPLRPAPPGSASGSARRASAARTRSRRTKRRTRTVIVEYELGGNGKTVTRTKRVKTTIRKKRKTKKRQPRTAARRTHVLASVRAKLATVRAGAAAEVAGASGLSELAVRRAGAGIPSLSLFGSDHQLDYFEDDEESAGGPARGPAAALASRPTPAVFSAYRQSRRKMVSIGSEAQAAPDLLGEILARQQALHSRSARLELGPGGRLCITERGKQAPAYPGQGRGWGGGYRYPRDHDQPRNNNQHEQHHHSQQNYGRGGYDNGFGGGGPGGGPFERRDDNHGGPFMNYDNRRPHYNDEEPWHDRNRRPQPDHNMRGNSNMPRNDERRFSSGGGPAWQGGGGPRREPPQRHSFGGFEGALDMRTAPPPPRADDKPPAPEASPPAPPAPQPEEDERSDEGLVIDTEKYDPTSPTHDEDSPAASPAPPPAPPAFAPAPAAPLSPSLAAGVQSILASMEARGLGVPPAAVLDSAVRAALHEHRALLQAPAAPAPGDCPNFSIYSATSVHIASDSSRGLESAPPEEAPPPDDYKAKLSKRCPITANARDPIKIRLAGPALIRRPVALYDDEDVDQAAEPEPKTKPEPEPAPALTPEEEVEREVELDPKPDPKPEEEAEPESKLEAEREPPVEPTPEPSVEDHQDPAEHDEAQCELDVRKDSIEGDADEERTDERDDDLEEEPLRDPPRECEERDKSDTEASSGSPRAPKMTESISETEDSRSYTPCLDERGLEPAEPGLEGLGTELISEEEAHDMFSEGSPPAVAPLAAPPEDGEILDKRRSDDTKKKKKKDGKKDKEAKGKGKKARGDVAFKKAARAKERSYREREKEKRRSSSSGSRRRRKDKRKDLERYDVRTLVSGRRRRGKDAFGRDVSPSRSPSAPRAASAQPEPSPRRARFSPSPSPQRVRLGSPSPRRRASPSPRRRASPSPRRARLASPSPRRARASPSPRRARLASPSPRRSPSPKRRRKRSGSRPAPARRRRSGSRARKRRRSPSPAAAASPKPAKQKKKKRSPRRRSQRRKRARRRSASPAAPPPAAAPASWSPPPPERAPSPRTPPPAEPPSLEERRRRRELERAHRRLRDLNGPSKEVFTSGDNILVSVSFQEAGEAGGGGRRARRLERRRRRRARAPPAAAPAAKPVAIIDLERSPFRELTPSPKNVIVLSDDEAAPPPAAPAAPPSAAPLQGPKTPPDPAHAAPLAPSDPQPAPASAEGGEARGPLTPPEPPDSPDAYDPFEPTRSPSASPPAPAAAPAGPAPPAADPERLSMTLEAAQKTNLSADELLDRRPLSPIEKVMALLQSTRDVPPEEPEVRAAGASPGGGPPAAEGAAPCGGGPLAAVAPAPRVLLPEAPRPTPKLFLAKPSPIKSDPIKPMPQATKISRLPLPVVVGVRRASLSRSPSPAGGAPGGASPYSPGESDFGDLFEPPPSAHRPARRRNKNGKNKRTQRGSKTTVEVQLDDDSLKVLDELPSSAVEMQVKSKFLKKLNRQERVVEEVKLVLKPHYNKKHVSKDEYKHILRRAVPKICHNKTGEINPTKIQALVEAYVKKFRKKRKLGQ